MLHHRLCAQLSMCSALIVCAAPAHAGYTRTDLASDNNVLGTQHDANLVNGWGLTFFGQGPATVACNGALKGTMYDGNGNPDAVVIDMPASNTPTGVTFNGFTSFDLQAGAGFPAKLLWATEQGSIAGWNPAYDATHAIVKVLGAPGGANYTGLTLDSPSFGSILYAADFRGGKIDAFNGGFGAASLSGNFTDPNLPAGYAPFNVKAIGANLYVTYAITDATGTNDVPGLGHGIVDVFDFNGNLQKRLATGGVLNSPWGVALAPADFGVFSGALLIGNAGDGRINAFDPATGNPLGTLTDDADDPIEIGGLHGLEFGNGVDDQPTSTLFFAAGPDGGAHGLFGQITIPAPGGGMIGVIGAWVVGRRRARV